jgi:hypothetical protein
MFCVCHLSLGSFIALSPQFIITVLCQGLEKSFLAFAVWLMYLGKQCWLMLISHYLIFKNHYVIPTFIYGMLCYVTISTSSWYVSMIGFMEINRFDDNDDNIQKILLPLHPIHNHNHSLCHTACYTGLNRLAENSTNFRCLEAFDFGSVIISKLYIYI